MVNERMTRCKQLLEKFENNIDLLRKCGKDKSIVGRVARYVRFCKEFNIPYAFAPEGMIRPLVQRWHKGEDVSKEANKIKKIIENEQQQCEIEIKKAEKIVEAYKALEGTGETLTKAQEKKLNKARKIAHTKRVDKSKSARNRIREAIKSMPSANKKSVPNGTKKVTLEFTQEQYEAVSKHFNEGHEAKDKKTLASQILAFLVQYVYQKV